MRSLVKRGRIQNFVKSWTKVDFLWGKEFGPEAVVRTQCPTGWEKPGQNDLC